MKILMAGDWLYVLGTFLQLVAFAWGTHIVTVGAALSLYGAGMVVAYIGGYLR